MMLKVFGVNACNKGNIFLKISKLQNINDQKVPSEQWLKNKSLTYFIEDYTKETKVW